MAGHPLRPAPRNNDERDAKDLASELDLIANDQARISRSAGRSKIVLLNCRRMMRLPLKVPNVVGCQRLLSSFPYGKKSFQTPLSMGGVVASRRAKDAKGRET